MIARNLLLLVFLSLWEVLLGGASASKVLRRRGAAGLHMARRGDSKPADQWDDGEDSNAMPMVTLRNLINREQLSDSRFPHAKMVLSNKERQSLKPKREVDSVSRKDGTPAALSSSKASNLEVRRVKNGTRSAETSNTVRSEKSFVHHKAELHSNKTRAKSGSRSRSRPDLSAHTTGMPGKGFTVDSSRKLNLTGSYGVLKLLSKENLVRIVNSQMQKVPGLGFPSKGSRSRKRDLIDVNHEPLETQREQRQDMAAIQPHAGFDNQTAFPYASSVTSPDLYPRQNTATHINLPSDAKPALRKGQDSLGAPSSDGGDNKSKHLTRSLSTPRSEVGPGPEKEAIISQTEPPFASTKRLPVYVLPETNDSPPSVLTMQPLGARGGSRAADSRRDPLTESARTARTDPGTAKFLTDEDHKLVNSSHVLRLQPAPKWSRGAKEAEVQATDPVNGNGLVFEEASESDLERGAQRPVEGRRSRSRSRRSWIWNQFFVIEEYAGPEPVLIGRLHADMDRHDEIRSET
ncbi:uncharacterized protein LOC106962983 [Poecilia latipinna]|uniref:uncharacterized protein LOC106962983 n=1 Tax=Poecilia latipinna TaxID=48699 RepID=UPI00072E1A1D|nr:PREDICTED: uncharacterized protein LOC106962983 [Poecilia latipinna]